MAIPKDFYSVIEDLENRNVEFGIATIIVLNGSSSGKLGDKAVFDLHGKRIVGWVGGGCVESRIGETVTETLADGVPRIIDVDLDSDRIDMGMPCGGIMSVFIEPHKRTPVMLVRGKGQIVESLAKLGHLLNFRVLVQTSEDEKDNFPDADQIFTNPLDMEDLDETIDYFILATHHRDDHEQTLRALKAKIPYVAAIASSKKAGLIKKYLIKNNTDADTISRFYSPAGLNLKAKSPEEIALSVMAEILMLRNNGNGLSMRI